MRLLFLDIETAPHLVYAWGLFDQTIGINQIVDPGYTLCWAAKWEGQRKIHFASVQHQGFKKMIRQMYDLLNQADAVVHYNGKKFDIPMLNTEFLNLGLIPPDDYYEIDLLRTARARFRFASNKLDYVAQHLEIGSKTQHKGMELWRDCMAGDKKAWKVMERYNRQDVNLLEPLYRKLLPWIKNHPNRALFDAKVVERPVCRNCGSSNIRKNGVRTTTSMVYQRWRCNDCGATMRGRRAIEPGDRKNVLV